MSEQPEPAAPPPAPPRPGLVARIADKRDAHKEHGRLYRLLFIIAGAIVTLCGLAMLLLPGPAFVVIPIGLAMLAMEFAWAENMLDKALTQAEKAKRTAIEASPIQKIFGVVATALGIAAFGVAAILWDIPILPV